jgi:4-aminobutyrate aminotransferase
MTNSGTESVEAAIKLARVYHSGSTQFICFLGAFFHRAHAWGGHLRPPAKPITRRAVSSRLMNGWCMCRSPTHTRPLPSSRPVWAMARQLFIISKGEFWVICVPGDDVAGILIEPVQARAVYIFPRLMTSSQRCASCVTGTTSS